MSARVKKAGRIGKKLVAVFLFLFLLIFNVQIGLQDGESSDISLFGLNFSIFIPSALATITVCAPWACYDDGPGTAICYYDCYPDGWGVCRINGGYDCYWNY